MIAYPGDIPTTAGATMPDLRLLTDGSLYRLYSDALAHEEDQGSPRWEHPYRPLDIIAEFSRRERTPGHPFSALQY